MSPATQAANPAAPGPRSPDELKEAFLRHHRAGDVAAMMSLFHLDGASPQIVELYHASVPRPQEEDVESADVLEITGDRSTDIPHTLQPERLLLLKFRPGGASVERYFYIGKRNGRYFLTLPARR